MKNEIKRLNDSTDNWLEEQRKIEAMTSVWDFDDRANFIKKEHEAKHYRENQIRQINQNNYKKIEPKQGAQVGLFIAGLIIFYVIFVIIALIG